MERRHLSEGRDSEPEYTDLLKFYEKRRLDRIQEVDKFHLRAANATVDLAYLVGASEDAHLGKGGKEGYVYDIESKSERWLEDIIRPAIQQELLKSKTFDVKKRGTRPEYRIQVWDKDLVSTIKVAFKRPEIVLQWPRPQQHAWARGFADAEGSATRNSNNQPQFSIYNKSLKKLGILGRILKNDEIHYGYYLPEDRDVYQMYLTGRENLQRFLDVGSGVSHPEKRLCLIQYLAE